MIIADTHVHVYPDYDVPRFFNDAVAALSSQDPTSDADLVLMLTERYDCDFFKALKQGQVDGVSIAPCDDTDAVALEIGGRRLWVIAGRQIVSQEGVEVLSLSSDTRIADRQPLDQILAEVVQDGAVPVLSWAPGKWLGKRGALIAEKISGASAGGLCLGDTSMRPPVWLEPGLMKRGRARGLSILYGSDPLPFAADQGVVGQYAMRWDAELDRERPVAALRGLLQSGTGVPVGRRSGNIAVVRRFLANQKVR